MTSPTRPQPEQDTTLGRRNSSQSNGGSPGKRRRSSAHEEHGTEPIGVRKRRRSSAASKASKGGAVDLDDEMDEELCIICLAGIRDRAVLPTCSHDQTCFECILQWAQHSRRCPLCQLQIGPYVIHGIRSDDDYLKYYLPPLPDLAPGSIPTSLRNARNLSSRAQLAMRQRGRLPMHESRADREMRRLAEAEADELDRALEHRRFVYRHRLFAKHIASNPATRFKPSPLPSQFAASQESIRRVTAWLRRELRVWPDLDAEFLQTYVIQVLKSMDVRSDSAVRLLSEFLDRPGQTHIAEHFAHELYSFMRSPYIEVRQYDAVVQYDEPKDLSPPRREPPRWRSISPPPPPPRARRPSHRSYSPNEDEYHSPRDLYRDSRSPSPPRARARSRSPVRLGPPSPVRQPHHSRSPKRPKRDVTVADRWIAPEAPPERRPQRRSSRHERTLRDEPPHRKVPSHLEPPRQPPALLARMRDPEPSDEAHQLSPLKRNASRSRSPSPQPSPERTASDSRRLHLVRDPPPHQRSAGRLLDRLGPPSTDQQESTNMGFSIRRARPPPEESTLAAQTQDLDQPAQPQPPPEAPTAAAAAAAPSAPLRPKRSAIGRPVGLALFRSALAKAGAERGAGRQPSSSTPPSASSNSATSPAVDSVPADAGASPIESSEASRSSLPSHQASLAPPSAPHKTSRSPSSAPVVASGLVAAAHKPPSLRRRGRVPGSPDTVISLDWDDPQELLLPPPADAAPPVSTAAEPAAGDYAGPRLRPASEIMAMVRARLRAEREAKAAAGIETAPPPPRTIDGSKRAALLARLEQAKASTAVERPRVITNDLRERLLARLEDEKKRTSAPVCILQEPPAPGSTPTDLETRLRKQAQLRARLAREKAANASAPVSNNGNALPAASERKQLIDRFEKTPEPEGRPPQLSLFSVPRNVGVPERAGLANDADDAVGMRLKGKARDDGAGEGVGLRLRGSAASSAGAAVGPGTGVSKGLQALAGEEGLQAILKARQNAGARAA